jgi:pimeloyl-ACP methyl ester carboxylesterase
VTTERILPVNGVELCTETFGDPGDPTVLLVGGMSSPMDWWEVELCERVAAGGRYVVRYDFRDTGRSTTCPPGRPDYTGSDLRRDIVALLDVLEVPAAHLVGVSMGAALAQCVAVEDAPRVRSLTLVATTAALAGVVEPLPGVDPALSEHLQSSGEPGEPDWADRDAVVEHLVDEQRAFMRAGFDEARVRALAEQVVDRSTDVAAMRNHALIDPGREPHGSLADIVAPTLVVHGTADPMFPLPHGEALARAVPGARLLLLDGMGHEPPPPQHWGAFVPALLQHTSGADVEKPPPAPSLG